MPRFVTAHAFCAHRDTWVSHTEWRLLTPVSVSVSVFLNLFLTSSQVHNYGTRTANRYRSHSCHTNLKQFTILYQDLKVWNSLLISITSSSSFLTFKKKMLEFFICKIMNWPSRTYAAPHFLFINDSRGGLSHKPGGFLRSPRHYLDLKFDCFL